MYVCVCVCVCCAVLARPAAGGQRFGSHDVMHLYQSSGSTSTSRRPSQHLEVMRRKDVFYSGSLLNIPQYKLAPCSQSPRDALCQAPGRRRDSVARTPIKCPP